MLIATLGFGLTKKNRDRIQTIAKAMEFEPRVVDLILGEYKFEGEEAVLIFGDQALKQYHKSKDRKVEIPFTVLPEPDVLEPGKLDQTSREKYLKDLRSLLEITKKKVNTITESSLPPMTAGDLRILEETLRKTGRTEWLGKTQDKKTIAITTDPRERGEEDMVITFAELYAIRAAMETLRVKEFQIVTDPKATSKSHHKAVPGKDN